MGRSQYIITSPRYQPGASTEGLQQGWVEGLGRGSIPEKGTFNTGFEVLIGVGWAKEMNPHTRNVSES